MKCLAPLQSLQWFCFAVHLLKLPTAPPGGNTMSYSSKPSLRKCHCYIHIFFPSSYCEKSANQPVLFGVHLGFGNLIPAALSDNNNINNIQSQLEISQIALFPWLHSNASTGTWDTFGLKQQTNVKFCDCLFVFILILIYISIYFLLV